MSTTGADPELDLVEVRLLGLPVDLAARSEEHQAGLMREFAHIAHSDPDTTDRIPERLLALVAELGERYEAFAVPARSSFDQARTQGAATVNLRLHVPADVGDAVDRIGAALDEADDFCRSGDLLTLATPVELVRYRHWILDEFKRQVAGDRPIPWTDYTGS